MKVLVTGSAGFIGSALSETLLARGDEVIGLDCHNDYYDVSLKEARLARFAEHDNYTHVRMDLGDREGVAQLFEQHQPKRVVNLAAQAGVRYSLTNPLDYIDSNIVGFAHILEGWARDVACQSALRGLRYRNAGRQTAIDRSGAPFTQFFSTRPYPLAFGSSD